ncbi:hypothetical protein FACS189451_11970 [Bacteroidia bacterium]|nr:hypothetical protein FACS189451_11970 [Bacteroidia bacterium]
MLKRSGQTWDDVVEPRATFADIDEKSLKSYIVMSKEKGEITTSAYAKLYAVAERTARNDLNELSDKQILKRVGETNLAKYILD